MKEILDLIRNDQLDNAIDMLSEKSIKIDDIQKELIILKSRLADINRDCRKGIIKEEEKNLQKNRIRDALIELTFNLKKKVNRQISREKIKDIMFYIALFIIVLYTIFIIIREKKYRQKERDLEAITAFILGEADDLFERKHCNYAYTKYIFVRDTIWHGKIKDNLKNRIEGCKTCSEYIKTINNKINLADSLINEEEYKYAINIYSEIIYLNDEKLKSNHINRKLENKLKGLLNIIDAMFISTLYMEDRIDFNYTDTKKSSKEILDRQIYKNQIKITGNIKTTDVITCRIVQTEKEKEELEKLLELKNEINSLLDRIKRDIEKES